MTFLSAAKSCLLSVILLFAWFYYKYIKVRKNHSPITIEVRNIRFFRGIRSLSHQIPLQHLSDTVSITFYLQKLDTKG